MSKQLYLDAIEERDEELRLAREKLFLQQGLNMKREEEIPEAKENGPMVSYENVNGDYEESITFTFENKSAQTKIAASIENMGYAMGQLLIAMEQASGKDQKDIAVAILNANEEMKKKEK